MIEEKCPFPGCPLENTGGCEPEYKAQCRHQAQVILDFHKDRLKNEANTAPVAQRQSGRL
jgi:hypothetical protein